VEGVARTAKTKQEEEDTWTLAGDRGPHQRLIREGPGAIYGHVFQGTGYKRRAGIGGRGGDSSILSSKARVRSTEPQELKKRGVNIQQ